MTKVQTIQLIITIALVLWFLACSAGCWFWYRLKARDRAREEIISHIRRAASDSKPVYPRWCWSCEREGRATRVGWTTREGEWGICRTCAEAIQERLRAKAAHARRMVQS